MAKPQIIQKVENLESSVQNHSTQLADIVTDLKLIDGTDCTTIIQSALDKKGWVRIVSPGTFIVGRLLIDSNTKLELMPGVTLKKKDGTNNYILVNKGHVQGYRNKNITLKGGKWVLNNTGNPSNGGDLSTNPQAWSGIGVLFRGVDNLTIEDIEDIGGEWKYSFLITDINKGYFRRININNESDGLHFQPPLNNITIEDITGVTHDDLISFTMGDYPRYSLGQYGNIENVICRNIYAGETTDEIIKMVGSGYDGKSIFKNMKFENIFGYATIYPIYIMKEDQAITNPCLKDTKIENVIFENINVKISGNLSYFCIGAASGDITIKKLRVNEADSSRPILLQKCNMSKVVLEDITVVPNSTIGSSGNFIRVDNTTEIIEQLILKDSNLNFNSATTSYYIINQTNDSVKNINLSNLRIKGEKAFLLYNSGVGTSDVNIFINNCNINVDILAMTSVKTIFYITNTKLIANTRILHLLDGADIRLISKNNNIGKLTINGVTVVRKLSVNGDISTETLLTDLTAIYGDIVIYDRSTDQSNKGLYFYNGTSWIKLA